MQAFRVGFVAFVLGTIGSIAVVVTPSWFPPAASVQADRHDQIYLALMIMASYIFAIVVCFLGYSMWKFRAKPGDMSDGEPIHGNTMLEIVWTLIPLVLVLGFAVYGAVVLSKNENTSNTQLVVNATGQEFEWTFDYPSQKVKSGILELPVNQKVVFKVHGVKNDVIHGFYIPAFREGIDAVPGEVTTLVATPTRLGTYNIICNMLCGIGHSQMRTVVNVVTQDEFDAWIHRAAEPAQAAAQLRAGGRQGPVHDQLRVVSHACGRWSRPGRSGPTSTMSPATPPRTATGHRAEDYVKESIVDPDKVIVAGFQPNVMPATFGRR